MENGFFAKKLKLLRKNKKLTGAQLGEILNVSKASISVWEKGTV